MSVDCLHLKPGQILPEIAVGLFRAVLVVEGEVSAEWQDQVSIWLVRSGCLYMMAWGRKCTEWDDSVDWANRQQFQDEIPEDSFVMTTWHDDEPLEEVFWFADFCAYHPTIPLPRLLIVHIAAEGRCQELIELSEQASKRDGA